MAALAPARGAPSGSARERRRRGRVHSLGSGAPRRLRLAGAGSTTSFFAPFGVHNFFSFLGTFSFGHPYASLGRPSIGLNEFLGTWAELALFSGLAVAAAGLLVARLRDGGSGAEEVGSRGPAARV